MFAARLVAFTPGTLGTGFGRTVTSASKNGISGRSNCVRWFVQDSRSGTTSAGGRGQSHSVRRKGLKETFMAPASGTAFSMGQGALAGASALGLGALAYYGLGLSNQVGTVDRAVLWPEEVKERIRDTYAYFGASIGLTAASAAAVFKTPALLNIVARQGMVALGVSIAAMIGTGMFARSIPYEKGIGKKQLAWALHCGVIGAVIAPICILGGPILTRAAWYTAGMIGGLSTIAVCAPNEQFLKMGGPLAMGFGVVFASSIASVFLPPTTALGAGVYSIALYGGLILFGGFTLYDTQKIIHGAERNHTPGYAIQKYDPINSSMGIYLDAINIFIRIAQILAMQGGGRKK